MTRYQPNRAPRGSFDKDLADLDALKGAALDAVAVDRIRKALSHHNNFIVAKAAKLASDGQLSMLLPEVLLAFDRFFADSEKSDPQCWAKNSLVKTLVAFEHRDKGTYLRGLRHQQMEATWGGVTDSVGTLRGECAHALVNCVGLQDQELLSILIELFADADKAVRVEAARAIGQVGGPGAVLLLRLRALLGPGEDAEVLGACYSALLGLEGDRAVSFIAQFLKEGDDAAGEAAFALAELRSSDALAVLIARRRAGADAWFGSVLLSAITLCRLPEALDYLVSIIEREEREAAVAIEAIGRAAPADEVRARVELAVRKSGSLKLEQALRQHLPAPTERG